MAIGDTFDAEVDKLRSTLHQHLASEFSSVRAELKSEVNQIREMMRSHLAALRSELITRTDDKLTTFQKTSSPFAISSEPAVMVDVAFSGDPGQLTSFLYSVYDALTVHENCFANNDRRVKWIARHFRPASSPAADWWISLVAENASLFESSIPEGQTASFPFRLEKLTLVTSFLHELVLTFSDPFADQKALKMLQGFEMGKLGIQQFNTKFNALSYRVKGINEALLIDYYQRALSDRVRRQALSRPDWALCRTVKDCQAVALLACRQLDDLYVSSRPVVPAAPANPMVSIPRDPTAMDVDVHASGARLTRTLVPSIVTFNFYRELCHQRALCWRCLKGYDESHRARKADTSLPSCPNPPVDSLQMDPFATHCQSQPLPPPMHQVAVASHVSPPPTLSSSPAASHRLSSGGLQYYHSPPHLAYPPPPHPHLAYPPPLPQPHYAVYSTPPHSSLPTPAHFAPSPSSLPPTVPYVLQPGPAASVSSPAPPPPVPASVAAVFYEYQDFDTPTYYDLPSGASEDPHDLGFWTVPDDDTPSSASISAIEFSSPLSVGARLILQVTLWAGKKAMVARALVDLGSDGDFIDSKFVALNGLSLLRRKFPIKASGFDRTPSASGLVTYFWKGVMTMIGSDSQLFDSTINLNSTMLGGI